jgi:signal transduction histidine kinase
MSLRLKMIIGICLLFAGLLAAMNVFISGYIQAGNEKAISDELAGMTSNGQIYVRQFLAVAGAQSDSEGFAAVARDAANELANVTGDPTAAYSTGGELLAVSQIGVFEALDYEDLQAAMDGSPAFTLNSAEGKTAAYCSYPVTVDGRDIGVMRTVIDCSAQYAAGNNMMHSLSIVTSAMFLVALLVSIVFIQGISSPVMKLAALSGAVARSIERNAANAGSVDALLKSKRRDEVGRLSRNFAEMIRKIDQQMSVINTDRAELKRLAEYRKEFYDSVTHELKSPLTSIGGYAEVLEENGFTDRDFFYKGIGHIKNESARMYGMVVALLEMSKLSSTVNYPKEVMDFSALVEEACDGMRFKAEKYGAAIGRDIDPGIRVFGSPDKLKEVLVNLLDNAIKYKSPGGDIHVIVRNRGRMAQASVINPAAPIPPEELPKLFEPFYRTGQETPREEGSSGLGLAICKQIIDQHAGRISMRNLPGGNIVVEASLPVYTGL